MMNLYLLTQTETTGYEAFDACVVCAENENEAKKIFPSDNFPLEQWATKPENVTAKLIGTAVNCELGIILSSFNAG